jgi:Haem-binding domain/Cytochrome P460
MTLRSHARVVLKLAAGCVVLFALLQFIRPEITNPPVVADLAAPEAVKSLLVNACYDCHSNQTRLRWFDRIVPAYWLVAHDVRAGREHLNFSDLGALPLSKQRSVLYESLNQVALGAMPPRAYRRVHPESVLSAEQLAVLEHYLHGPEPVSPATPAQVASAKEQYSGWLVDRATEPTVRATLNGISYLPEYKNWEVISSTDRFDDHRFRAILGNGVAARAVAANQTNPWPDGSILAKVSWDELADPDGSVHMGEFRQVAFMIKDRAKYAATQGWGYAQWMGTQLEPYGKSANFSRECTGCHEPMRAHDFVFTLPVAPTSVPRSWRLISSGVEPKGNNMSQLYGNDVAVEHARHVGVGPYPLGAALSRIVWQQREDPNWFGGRIPGRVKSIDVVTVSTLASNDDLGSQPLLLARASVMP